MKNRNRFIFLLTASLLLAAGVPFSRAAAQTENLNGKDTVFVSSFGKVRFGDKTYSAVKTFDEAVKEMKIGEIKNVHLMPEDAYGLPDPAAIFNVDISELPGSENLEEGQQVYLTNQFGQPIPVTVAAKDETTITFDANHEMAGKELNFKIELVEVL